MCERAVKQVHRHWLPLSLSLLCWLVGCGAFQESPTPSTPEPSLEAPADPLPAPAVSGDGAEVEPDEGSEPAEVTESIPAPEDLVRVEDWIPDIYTDLRYATDNNFTGQAIYDFSDAYLRYGTVEKLAAVQETVAESGCSLLIWDAFRPASAQFRLWEICPDPAYVANPEKGFSSHSRGNTVDVTLVTTDGQPVDMPTDFDDFTALADRDYSDIEAAAAANARLLESAMTVAGFRPYSAEWWHFSDIQSYPVDEQFIPLS